jgi:hypothetical protein
MLRSRFVIAGAAIAMATSAAGCSSSSSGPPNTTPPPPAVAAPPGPVTGAPAGDGPGIILAVSELYLGDIDRDGTSDPTNGWKQYGFDIDGQTTYNPATHCKPNSGADATAVFERGNNGINNSFGHNIFSNILYGLDSGASATVNSDIMDGKFTVILDITKLGTQPSYNGLPATLYGGADLGHAAAFNGSDVWPLLPNGTTGMPIAVQFPESYLANNTWVSGSKGTVSLNLSIMGVSLDLSIGAAQIAMDINTTRSSATNGTISGVLNTEALVSQIQQIAGSIGGGGLCSGPTVASILNEISQASDIMDDGTQNPDETCNGISIGLGFNAAVVQLGSVAAPLPPGKNACAMGGASGSSTTTGTGGAGGAGG